MPVICAATGCNNKFVKGSEIRFYRFPLSKPQLASKWVHSLGMKNFTPTANTCLCSEHFRPDCFKDYNGKQILRHDAVPTLFTHGQKSSKRALTVKEKAARHRQHIQNDPAAREAYLAKRKASYQRRRREGKIVKPRINQLRRKEQEKLKQQWRQYQRKHRERKRATEAILNFKPESLDITPPETPAEPQPNPPNTDIENNVSLDVMQTRASSKPQRVANSNKKWLRKKAKMCSKMHKMKTET